MAATRISVSLPGTDVFGGHAARTRERHAHTQLFGSEDSAGGDTPKLSETREHCARSSQEAGAAPSQA